jgi:hypothetical protein
VLVALVALLAWTRGLAEAASCRATLRNLSACAWMNGLPTDASAAAVDVVARSMENDLPPHYAASVWDSNYSTSAVCKTKYFEFVCASYAPMLALCDEHEERVQPCYEMCEVVEDCFRPPLPRGAMCASLGFAANGSACVGTAGLKGMQAESGAADAAGAAGAGVAEAGAVVAESAAGAAGTARTSFAMVGAVGAALVLLGAG